MKFSLVENALDSLDWSLKQFNSFLKKDPYFESRQKSATFLKQAIVNLNGCLELMFKKLISDINEILIYDVEKPSAEKTQHAIFEYYRAKKSGLTQLPMYNYFIENNPEVHTVSYSRCIESYCDIYEIGYAYSAAFNHLNNLRNSIMHLGVDYKEQYYILVEYIDKALWFIQNTLLPELKLNSKVLTKWQTAILPIESSFADIGDNLWMQLYKNQIDNVANKLEEIFKCNDIQSHLANLQHNIEFHAAHDSNHSSANMFISCDGISTEILTAYHDLLTRSLIICDDQSDATVIGIIPLAEKDKQNKYIYLCKNQDGANIKKIDHQSAFWMKPPYDQEFSRLPYNDETLKKLIKCMIDCCNSVEFVDK